MNNSGILNFIGSLLCKLKLYNDFIIILYKENKSNNNISPESDDTGDIYLLLNDFKTALKGEYITTIINKMIYVIQNNVTSEIIKLN